MDMDEYLCLTTKRQQRDYNIIIASQNYPSHMKSESLIEVHLITVHVQLRRLNKILNKTKTNICMTVIGSYVSLKEIMRAVT